MEVIHRILVVLTIALGCWITVFIIHLIFKSEDKPNAKDNNRERS